MKRLAYSLASLALRLDPLVMARLYTGMSVKQRLRFWEALETTVPEAWHNDRRDLRKLPSAPSKVTTKTLAAQGLDRA